MTGNYDKALELMSSREPEKALAAYEFLEKARKQGDHRATYAIGTWHLHGFYFKKNVRKGVALIAQAAENGIANAAFDLGVSYETGVGRKVDENKALCCYMRAFLLGSVEAAKEIERLLYWGGPTLRNRALSREFSKISAFDAG